jgi:hypothetical protein
VWTSLRILVPRFKVLLLLHLYTCFKIARNIANLNNYRNMLNYYEIMPSLQSLYDNNNDNFMAEYCICVWPYDDNLFCLVENLSIGNGRN